jgi:hypothetical protein
MLLGVGDRRIMSGMSRAYDLRAWLEKADDLGQLKHRPAAE